MPTDNEVRPQIRQFISDNFLYGKPSESIADSDSLLEGGVIDSMGVLELVTFLEERFSIRVADADVVPQNLDSVGRITAYVCRKLRAAGEPVGSGHAR